ncbi:MAG: hypothetical protein WA667_01775, partial [Candidatus Nitrosopolaris sp.]
DTFLQYLKKLQRKFRKLILFLDRAVQHYRSIKVRKHLEENKDVIRVDIHSSIFNCNSVDFNIVVNSDIYYFLKDYR